jgi:catechol 2,3-dioxygenase-like lactoylglutathione lyase family enzyme
MSTPNPSPTDAVAASPGISPVKLSHVFFLTRALAPMRDWYVAVLQARIAFALGNVCFLTYDSEHHRVAIVEMADAVPSAGPKRVGVNHVAFTYRDLAALVHTCRRLKAVGIAPYWTINHGVTTSMYYRDPDGNSVELQIDNFASEAETVAFMAAHLPEKPRRHHRRSRSAGGAARCRRALRRSAPATVTAARHDARRHDPPIGAARAAVSGG